MSDKNSRKVRKSPRTSKEIRWDDFDKVRAYADKKMALELQIAVKTRNQQKIIDQANKAQEIDVAFERIAEYLFLIKSGLPQAERAKKTEHDSSTPNTESDRQIGKID